MHQPSYITCPAVGEVKEATPCIKVVLFVCVMMLVYKKYT